MIEILPIEKIRPSERNDRKKIGDISELAASIQSLGLLQPLVVTPNGNGTYEIVAGHRRFGACKQVGMASITCQVLELEEISKREVMLTENMQREDLSVLEEAEALQGLLELGATQRNLADRLGISQSKISKRLTLLELPAKVRSLIDSGGITPADGLELAKLAGMPKHIDKVLERVRHGWKIPESVTAELRLVDRDRRRSDVVQKLKGQKIQLVERPSRGWYSTPQKIRPLKGDRSGEIHWGELNLTPAQHKNEPCHAAHVSEDGGVIYVCLEPNNHEKASKASKAPKKDDKAQKLRAHRKALREAEPRRHEFIVDLLRPSSRAKLDPHLAIQLVRASEFKITRTAVDLLEIAGHDHEGTLIRNVVDEISAYRIARALALAAGEAPLRGQHPYFGAVPVKAHFDFLKTKGYEISQAEKLELAGKAPRP